jgi:hypothetical protein
MTMAVIGSAVCAALTTGLYCLRLLRNLTNPRVSSEELGSWIDINVHSCRPLERLLNPVDFEFLRKRGMSRRRILQVRSERRRLFRMYLRRLTSDFNMVCGAMSEVLVHSAVDRPDMARNLGVQRIVFYRRLVEIELRLRVSALVFDTALSLDLIRPLQTMHAECCRLLPAASPLAVGA